MPRRYFSQAQQNAERLIDMAARTTGFHRPQETMSMAICYVVSGRASSPQRIILGSVSAKDALGARLLKGGLS